MPDSVYVDSNTIRWEHHEVDQEEERGMTLLVSAGPEGPKMEFWQCLDLNSTFEEADCLADQNLAQLRRHDLRSSCVVGRQYHDMQSRKKHTFDELGVLLNWYAVVEETVVLGIHHLAECLDLRQDERKSRLSSLKLRSLNPNEPHEFVDIESHTDKRGVCPSVSVDWKTLVAPHINIVDVGG